MATARQTTYKDVLDHLVDFLGVNVAKEAVRDARRALLSAYREFGAVRRWSFYYQRGRLSTVAPYSTGTVAYTHSTRTLTLTSGTWPTWAANGVVAISNVAYDVQTRTSNTALVLSSTSNPGADVAAGTSYTIYRDTYPLPSDFLAMDQAVAVGSSVAYPEYVHPREWLLPQQTQQSPGTPRAFTITRDPDDPGTMAVRFHPAPDAAYSFDFVYHARPRPLLIDDYSTGTASVTSGQSTVTGNGTVWTSRHVGCVVRLSPNATDLPVGPTGIGGTPYDQERIVLAADSATQLTVDSAWTGTLSGVKYRLSDPVDVEEGAMLSAFLRGAEKELGYARQRKDREELNRIYQEALIRAMEADSRAFTRRAAGADPRPVYRFANMPRGADIG